MRMTVPLVTALICTRDRPHDAVQAVRSVMASEGVEIDLIVIDQSDGPETGRLLAQLPEKTGLRYVRSTTRGVGSGLNEGLRLARSPYVIRTDDDCLVPAGWLAGMAAILQESPDVALVFCNVIAEPYDRETGYVPTYEPRRTRTLRSPLATCRGRGLGAGMGLRRDAVLEIGGLDTLMGPGGILGSADDFDLELRILLRGWQVVDTADLAVVHRGFRTFDEGRSHTSRDWLGIGAVLGKLTRTGHPSAIVLAGWELSAHAAMQPLVDLIHLRRPRGIQRIISFGRGYAKGLVTSVDSRTMRFINEREMTATPAIVSWEH
jgi:GT2 family glycosyltransferase